MVIEKYFFINHFMDILVFDIEPSFDKINKIKINKNEFILQIYNENSIHLPFDDNGYFLLKLDYILMIV